MRLADAEAGELSWHDVWLVCHFASDESPLVQARRKAAPPSEDGPPWEPRNDAQTLMALLINTLLRLDWRVANIGRRTPEPQTPPKITVDAKPEKHREVGDVMTIDQARQWLARRRAQGKL